MLVRINGRDEKVDNIDSIASLVSEMKLSADKIVVEHNMRIVPKEEWQNIILKDKDNIEIVSFVGGG